MRIEERRECVQGEERPRRATRETHERKDALEHEATDEERGDADHLACEGRSNPGFDEPRKEHGQENAGVTLDRMALEIPNEAPVMREVGRVAERDVRVVDSP